MSAWPPVEAPTSGASPPDEAETFGEWVRPHWPDLVRLARRLSGTDVGDDVVQEALSSAWRKRGQFDANRGTARNWLLAIVADQARKHHRNNHSTVIFDDRLVSLEGPSATTRIDLAVALGQLSERQRLATGLYYYLGLPVADVALIMNCSVGTVKSTLSDARSRLRSILGEEYA